MLIWIKRNDPLNVSLWSTSLNFRKPTIMFMTSVVLSLENTQLPGKDSEGRNRLFALGQTDSPYKSLSGARKQNPQGEERKVYNES